MSEFDYEFDLDFAREILCEKERRRRRRRTAWRDKVSRLLSPRHRIAIAFAQRGPRWARRLEEAQRRHWRHWGLVDWGDEDYRGRERARNGRRGWRHYEEIAWRE